MSVGLVAGSSVQVLLGGYPAKQCVRRVHNDHDVTVPEPPAPPSDVVRRMGEGVVFEAEVTEVFAAGLGGDCLVIEYGDHRGDKARRIGETLAAMKAGVPVIVGGQLPDSYAGSRTGSPDVLIRYGTGAPVYLPGDVKHHSTLKSGGPRTKATVSGLAGVDRRQVSGWTSATSHRVGDAMQLAHYTRMLQECGFHPGEDVMWGAILGSSDFTEVTGERYGFVWYDLAEATEKVWGPDGAVKVSVQALYDGEFARRVEVAQVARSGGVALVAPSGKSECRDCPYLTWCRAAAGPADASFAIVKGMVSDREWDYLRSRGLGTITALAGVDLAADEALVAGYRAAAVHLSAPEKRLAGLVARARMHRDQVAYELRPGTHVVPSADVEIDFDVEWHPADGHVYQWGARVRFNGEESSATYAPSVFSTDVLDEAGAVRLAEEFFGWMEGFIADQEAQGRTVRVFHWTNPEVLYTRRMLGAERADALMEGRFVDLKAWFEATYMDRDGYSLKQVAPALGFAWLVEDAGGNVSIEKIEQARAGDSAARAWLLAYNEDDCAAQAHIRDALAAQGLPALVRS